MDLDELARSYWAAPPYDDHEHDVDYVQHPFDRLQDLQLDATDDELTAMLRSLARTAETDADLAHVGGQWVAGLEYKFDAEGEPGKSVRLLIGAGLDDTVLARVLAGIEPSWLASMGAADLLAGVLTPQQIARLVSTGSTPEV